MDTNNLTKVSPEAETEAPHEGEAFEPAPFRPTRKRLAWSAGAATAFFASSLACGLFLSAWAIMD